MPTNGDEMKPRIMERVGPIRSVTPNGEFDMYGYRIREGDQEETHLALVHGKLTGIVPTRINSACLTSEVFEDDRCDCAWQLKEALSRFTQLGQGVLVYHPSHEGRGIGLLGKLRTYELMAQLGIGTKEAFERLGYPVDERTYAAAIAILEDLGVREVDLLSSNPDKMAAFTGSSIEVVSVNHLTGDHNPKWRNYLQGKADGFGHAIGSSGGQSISDEPT